MSDRTYCRITIAARHQSKLGQLLEQEGFTEQDDNSNPTLTHYTDSEANYGGSSTLDSLQGEGRPFTGYHEAGGDYGPAVFAYDGTRYAESAALGQEAVCILDPNGEPNPHSLTNAREFLVINKLATTKMTTVRARKTARRNA